MNLPRVIKAYVYENDYPVLDEVIEYDDSCQTGLPYIDFIHMFKDFVEKFKNDDEYEISDLIFGHKNVRFLIDKLDENNRYRTYKKYVLVYEEVE